MTIMSALTGERPTATFYVRTEGAMPMADLAQLIAPLLTRYRQLGDITSAVTPVTWSLKRIDTGDPNSADFQWEVASGVLRGLVSTRVPSLGIDASTEMHEQMRQLDAYQRTRPPAQFTSYKVNLVQTAPGDATAVRAAAYDELRAARRPPAWQFTRFVLYGQPISGDRGEVATPAAPRAVPRWAIAAGILGLAGIVATAMSGKRRKR